MKKIYLMAFIAITTLLVFTRCEKDTLFSTKSKTYTSLPNEIQKLYDQMPQRKYGKIPVLDGNILCFASKEHYQHVAEQLLRDCEIWDSLFYNAYSYMTETELNDWEERIRYNEFLPLIIFDETYGVSGRMLFDKQQTVLQMWLDNGLRGPNPTDPIFNIEADQAMFNPNREICVDDTIYQFRPDALILIPVARLGEWLRYRGCPTADLAGRFTVRADRDSTFNYNNLADMPSHYNFTFKDDDQENTLTSANFPTALRGLDYAHWSVVGRRGLVWSHVMTSKLVNYKFVRMNNQGNKVYKKTRRHCSIISHQSFSTEQYEQFFQNFQCWGADTPHDVLPNNKYVKTFSKRVTNQYVPINFLSHDYRFGIFTADATVEVRVGNGSTPIIIPLF